MKNAKFATILRRDVIHVDYCQKIVLNVQSSMASEKCFNKRTTKDVPRTNISDIRTMANFFLINFSGTDSNIYKY